METMGVKKVIPTRWIILVTRNRLTAVTDNCAALKRFAQKSTMQYGLILQDNSDVKIPLFIVAYLKKYFHVIHVKTAQTLSMSDNWDQGVSCALKQGAEYICILSDRRLPTLNLDEAFNICTNSFRETYLVFDHQRTWINRNSISAPKYTGAIHLKDSGEIIQECLRCNFDGYTPRLFNCIVSKIFFGHIYRKFGSFVGGSAPDINFQSRVAFMKKHNYGVYDSPCITTNARQVSHSNGTNLGNAIKSIARSEYFELSKPKSYPPNFEITTTGRCLGEVLEYSNSEFMSAYLNKDSFVRSIFMEISFPQSQDKYYKIKSIMKEYLSLFYENKKELIDIMNNIPWLPPSQQTHPLDTSNAITNAPHLDYITQVETK